MHRNNGIYLPQGYDPAGSERYPAVYFLHGATYGYPIYWTYVQMKASLDYMIWSGQITPLIMVTPDGLIGPYSGSWWTDSELHGNIESFVVQEVVDYLNSNYRAMPHQSFPCLQGLSMGGYGAMKLALKHSDVFGATPSHSRLVDLRVDMEICRDAIFAEYPGGPPYVFQPTAGHWSDRTFSLAGAFFPNLKNPPYFVDFPLDQSGEFDVFVMARWRLHACPYLASELPPCPWDPETDLDVFFDAGTLAVLNGGAG